MIAVSRLVAQDAATSSAAPQARTAGATLAPSAAPSVQYTLAIGRPAAAPAEAASDQFFSTSEAVAKARSQVEKELAVLGNGSLATPAKTLVIPREETDLKSMAETEEDMSVMSHILDKAASSKDDKNARAMGITIHGAMSSSTPRNLYLDGYGALFFLNVNYPLLPPPNKKEETQPKQETSTEWEDARRELFQPSSYSSDLAKLYTFDQANGAFAFASGGPAEEFDADKVEELKNNLIGALKNAVHIRKLKADETVTIVVNGRNANTEVKARRTSATSRSSNAWIVRTGGTENKATRLIVRAKKSDIEAFQKDKTSLEEFRKHVSVMTY